MTVLEAATRIVAKLQDAGFEACFAGGCVRDHLLGKDPADYDVATSAQPDEVQQLFRRTIDVGKAFGVIRVLSGSFDIEVATFRKDADYGDGRRPDSVTFTDAKEDVLRRDFTVNGLLWDPIKDVIIDHVGGRDDLKRRIVRAIGDPHERFKEDGLRLLRAIRFGTLGDFRIDPDTIRALTEERARIRNVAPERMHDELRKIAVRPESRRGDALALLHETELWNFVLGTPPGEAELEALVPIVDRLTVRSLPALLALAVRHLHPRGNTPRHGRHVGEDLLQRLRGSREERTTVGRILEFRWRYRSLLLQSLARQRLAAAQADREVQEACLAAEGDANEVLALLRATRERFGPELPQPLLNGRDLIAQGVAPDRTLGRKLRRVRLLQLLGDVQDADAALAVARRR